MGLKNNHDVFVGVDVTLWVVLWVVVMLGIDSCIFDRTVTFIIYPILLITPISSISPNKQKRIAYIKNQNLKGVFSELPILKLTFLN